MNSDKRENYDHGDRYFQDNSEYKDENLVSNVLDNSITNDDEKIFSQQDPDEDYRDPDDIDPDDLEDENFTDADELEEEQDLFEDNDKTDDLHEKDIETNLDDEDDEDDEDDIVKHKRNLYRDRDL
ncbi:hypothetical protein [Flavobacterium fluviatile]|uniref:hypothetical protein n=1 Tax=Flavobacterium fluviatile TaxID=1862387 RepID=UPI0013D3E535|nr:hypothetical protein [Flavobacterium fluviatile]